MLWLSLNDSIALENLAEKDSSFDVKFDITYREGSKIDCGPDKGMFGHTFDKKLS